jgi:hypothetical protein
VPRGKDFSGGQFMTGTRTFVLRVVAACVFAACTGSAPAYGASAPGTTAKIIPGPPARNALVTLEKRAYEAWKSKDATFWDSFLSDRFVGYGPSGKLDKASATKQYTGADCDIRRYALSDARARALGKDVVLLTHRSAVDGTCSGQKVPANSWAASIYVRDGGTWKAAFHAEAAIVDPKAASAGSAVRKQAPVKSEAGRASPDARTDALMAAEKANWEAWKDHDAKRLEHRTTREISFIDIFGNHFADKAETIKDWTGPGCKIKRFNVADGVATMLSATVAILRFTGTADGTCFGRKIDSAVWGTSVYVRQGGAWKWAFGINLPAGR